MIDNRKVLVCFNEPLRYYSNYLGKDFTHSEENIDLSESDFFRQIDSIKEILSRKFSGVDSLAIGGDIKKAYTKILEYSPDIIMNFVESIEGKANYESYVAGFYELLDIPYTGNTANCLGNCLIKSRTKNILKSHGIKSPGFMITSHKNIPEEKSITLRYPMIVKLLKEDASIGISEFSVVHDYQELRKRINYLFNHFKQDLIIEEYIEGRELNVSVLGDRILPISEITFDGLPKGLPKIVTYEAKWSPESVYYKNTVPKCPAPLPDQLKERIEKIAYSAFCAMDCRDYARVDIRLSRKNVPYVIEINPNPDISPDSGFIRSAAAVGISYEEVLYTICNFATKRIKNDTPIAV